MRPPKFEYAEPESMEEATSLLAENIGETCVVSGGTELYVQMKQRLLAPKKVAGLMKSSAGTVPPV